VELAITRVPGEGPVQFTGFLRDRSETRKAEEALRRSEEQLRVSQKMEAVGRLAGGVAHDFNNLLTVILGHSELILAHMHSDDPIRREIEEIGKAGERAAGLTRQLLAFSRRQVLQMRVLDLNEVVADMEKMLRRLIGEDIELVTQPGANLARVKSDPGQLEQVIMNLAVNARDAMPDGGRLTLQTAGATLDDARRLCDEHPGTIHLLLTDVVMPVMSGRGLANVLSGLRPEMRVLYMSGYTDDAIMRQGILVEGVPFLQKPFTPQGLAAKVREVLDESSTGNRVG